MKQAKSYEAVNDGTDKLFDLRDKILAGDGAITFNLLGHSLTYYDGGTSDAFTGLALGELGDYGVPVRSETLVATSAIWTDAYGSIPAVLQDKASLPGTYPTEFKDLLPDKCGYQYKSSAPYETGYYVEGNKIKFDFHDSGVSTYGRALAMRDPLGHEAGITFDNYDLLPKTVTDPVGMQTEAWYDYRLLAPYKAKDPNDNFSEFAFNRLGMLYKSAVKAKYDVADGSSNTADRLADDLDHPTSLLEYDFFNFIDNGGPVWVKTTQRQYHYYGPTPEFGDKADTIIGCEYSDGFGRLLQTRAQAEEVVYGDPTFGSSGLPADQTANGDCVGYENTDTENPNVVVNGWTVYNNKGKAVEQYEPFFAKGFDYVDGQYANISSAQLWYLVKEYVEANGESALSNSATLAAYINTATNRSVAATAIQQLLKDLHIIRQEVTLADDYIDFGNRSDYDIGTSDFSVSFWARMDAAIDQGDTFVSNRKYDGVDTYTGGFTIKANTSTNQIQFIVSDGTGAGSAGTANLRIDLPSKEEWHHIVWVRKGNDANDWTCYLDGVAQTITIAQNNLSDGDISDNSSMKIGSMTDGNPSTPGYFDGIIREVKIYTRQLVQADIDTLYDDACGKQSLYPGDLVLYAPLNDNNGDTVADLALGQSGSLQLNSYTWSLRFIDSLHQICADDALAQKVMGKGFMGQKARIFYDPRGQVVRSLNPDNTESRVVMGTPHDLTKPPLIAPFGSAQGAGAVDSYTPSPWVSYAFDPNDLGNQYSLPTGEGWGGAGTLGLIDPNDSTQGYTNHFATPKSSEIDELGRTIKTTEHMGTGNAADDVVMQYEYDIRGNVTRIEDALERTVFEHKYDLANQTLWTSHLDSGEKTVVYDLMGRPTEMQDAKGSWIVNSYDELSRPVRMWAADDGGQSLTLRSIAIFGDDSSYGPASPKTTNHLGKPYRAYDEAGLVEISEYDFKGGAITKKQQVISDTTLLSGFPTSAPYNVIPYTVDWVGLGSLPSILDSTIYQTDVDHYDAMGRPGITTLPADVNAVRKELKAEYNRAGAIKKVYYDGTEYIKEMAFNAKGQPLMTALGNGIMTRYAYSSTNFRLLRSQSEKFTYTNTGSEHKFAYNSGTKKHNTAHQYDLAGNILKILERSTDCGLSGTPDQLDRKFSYDPLNRLLSATGRETTSASDTSLWDDPSKTGSGGNPSPSSMQAYTRTYEYDKMGNILQLKQTAGNTFTRNFHYDNISTNNLLHSIKKADDTTNYSTFTYDSNGNKLTAGTTRNYIWDYADQLKAYLNQTGTSEPSVYAQYLYSGGQRVKKLVRSSGGGTETTVYIDGVFEHKYDGTNSQSIVRVGGVASVRTGYAFDGLSGTSYNLSNHLGSVSIRLDGSGNVIDREEYYPFGDSSVRTWDKKRYRYVGKEKDAESGLYYYGARYYSAWTCRFISVDPLAWEYPFYTPYQYAGNKPINFLDIDGLEANDGGSRDHASGTYNQESGEYTVAKGDTIFSIAARFDMDYELLAKINGVEIIDGKANIKEGETLKIDGASSSTKSSDDNSNINLSIFGSEYAITSKDTLAQGESTLGYNLYNYAYSDFDFTDPAQWAALPGKLTAQTLDAFWVWLSTGDKHFVNGPEATPSEHEQIQKTVLVEVGAFAFGKFLKLADESLATLKAVDEGYDLERITRTQVDEFVKSATKQGKSDAVMLGKFNQNGVSYVSEAQKTGYTYFNLDNWEEVAELAGDSIQEIWKINREFLYEQFKAGKKFYFSHNPNNATGYFEMEVNYIKNVLGAKDFVKVGNYWRAVF